MVDFWKPKSKVWFKHNDDSTLGAAQDQDDFQVEAPVRKIQHVSKFNADEMRRYHEDVSKTKYPEQRMPQPIAYGFRRPHTGELRKHGYVLSTGKHGKFTSHKFSKTKKTLESY